MAKKENEEAKKAEGAAPAPDTPEAAGKKRKILLLAGIGGLLTVALAGGGFFAYKTFLGGKKGDVAMSAKNEKSEKGDAKEEGKKEKPDGDAKADPHANSDEKNKSSGKGDVKSEVKSEEKDGHKADDKAEGKADEKGDAKANEKDGPKDEGKREEKKEDKEGDAKEDDKPKKNTREKSAGFGETIDLPKMDLNLGNPLENRFLRMSITIEYHGGESQKDEIKRREPQLKDIVITSISSKSRLELLTEKGKERLRKELTNRFNEVLDRPVKSLFFTDFLVE